MPLLRVGYKLLHYTDAQPSGPVRETLVLTHGLGSSQDFYGPIVPQLTAQSFRCIAFDTTGAARSPYTCVEQSVASLAADALAVLDALEVRKAVVVGHSMGGIVAAHLAATASARIVAAVLIGPVLPSPAVADVFEKRIRVVAEQGMEAMANTIPGAAVGAKASALTKAFIRELLLGQDARGYVSSCRVIAGAEPPDYAHISIPCLIIAGAEDKSAPLEGCKKILAAIGAEEKRMEVLDGVGHWHCLEAPDEVARRIIDFYHQIQ
ncbi:hypothetical protein B0A49_05985 [Cryomyces minteri]|uniref:AB hydrolase-1 domain-containing protein n=1 Tax=Cryomyces minteri TaxID=331657 RepID=A0A4U0X8Y1_9PEZI|nr:hypothetical protein B0A49_05985 [Cryomyces minteri]